MDFTLIATFLDLAATGSFSRTADRVHITQSAVSARIKTLEQSLNCRLFERDHNGASLTEAGQRFLSYATSINRLWHQGRQNAAMGSNAVSRIGAGIHVCLWRRVALQWMHQMRREMPEIGVRMEVDYSEQLTAFVEEGVLDFSLIYTPRALPGLKVEKLFEDQLVLVSDTATSLGPHLVSGYVYIDWSYGYRQKHAELLPDFSSPITIIGNPETAMDYILDHGGSGYFPASDVEEKLSDGLLHRVQGAPVLRRPCYVTYAEKSGNEAQLAAALEVLRRVTAGLGSGPQDAGHYARRSFVVRESA